MYSYLTHLECTNCGATCAADELHTVCPACGKVLYPRYDLAAAARAMTREALKERPFTLWRYHEVLPVQDPRNALTLGEGGTPLLPLPRFGGAIGLPGLMAKDEGLNPTGSFKARGLCLAVSRAKEFGVRAVAIPSAGNAASAMSAYAARAGLPAYVFMPQDTPPIMKGECAAYGAHVYLVKGLINDAGRITREHAAEKGWFDVSTLKEPYRVEGKKTMGYELAEQLGWTLPDVILYPTGGGTGIVGMWKAFGELEEMGFIGPARPKMVVVQSEGCAPIVRAFAAGQDHAEFWEGAATIAPGVRVPVAIGDYLILQAVYESRGTAVAVSDREILATTREVAASDGLYPSPEAAATFAAARRLVASGFLTGEERVVAFSTGAGLKHTELLDLDLPVLDPADPRVGDKIR
ncbi:MAG TPA: threonine synthase [Thermomicrobiales bacterium]|nr:threonine synthase [Thermomicrobiales bacterium]